MSGINKKFKNVFIHIPKCAGGSMASKDFVGGIGHKTLSMLSIEKGFDRSYIKWCFVRNPYDRIESAYFWILHKHKNLYKNFLKPAKLTKDKKGLEYFIENLEEMLPDVYDPYEKYKCFSAHIYPMFYFIKHPSIRLDFIGRMENIKDDWLKIISRIEDISGRKIRNKSLIDNKDKIIRPRKIELDNYHKKIIENVYKKDFEMFSY